MAEAAFSNASTIVGLIELVWNSLSRQVSYVRNYSHNFNELETNVAELRDIHDDVQTRVDTARAGRMIPRRVVQTWLEKAERKANETDQEMVRIAEMYREEACLGNKVPNCWSRRNLGKRLVEMNTQVENLEAEGRRLSEGSVADAPPSRTTKMVVELIHGETAQKQMEKIMECLQNERTGIIGVWGMAGVGKTTILNHIYNEVLKFNDKQSAVFDPVVFITVSRGKDAKSLRRDIAKKILPDNVFYDWDKRDEPTEEIIPGLESKRYLLILDDMWEAVELSHLGVPIPSRQNGCKLIIASRDNAVCNLMHTDETIKLDTLEFREAWDLFREKAGAVASLMSIRPTAEGIVKECDGLPLALVTLGSAMRNKLNPVLWQNALDKLRAATPDAYVDEKVFATLQLSFDNLKNDDTVLCFLYCSLFSQDILVEKQELVDYWRMEELLSVPDKQNDKQVNQRGHSVVEDLKDVCLLQEDTHVKMHDLMKLLCLRMTKNVYYIKADEDIDSLEQWTSAQRISLTGCKISSLPDGVEFPNLSTLFLARCPLQTDHVPPNIFSGMLALRILILKDIGIKYLPGSIVELHNLRALRLINCVNLRGIADDNASPALSLANLKVLQLGDLPSLVSSPKEGTQLTLKLPCVKQIDVYGCPMLITITLYRGEEGPSSLSLDGLYSAKWFFL